jgi:spore coat polysaccharide biosynthesis protein SpsF
LNQPDLKTIAIIQARRAASRLPDKVLLDIASEPMLVRVVERTRRAKSLDGVVVATTTDPYDDAVEALCRQRGYACYRGSMHDVLDRYYQAARLHKADVIVRITADCPVIDPDVIDETVRALFGLGDRAIAAREQTAQEGIFPNSQFLTPIYDFTANRLPPPWKRTYPIGLDTEVCTFPVLETAWKEAVQPHQREHVMPFFYEQPERFRTLLVNYKTDLGALRWTVDTSEDLELLRRIYAHFGGRDDFSWLEVLELVQHHPDLGQINAAVQHKDYRQIDHRR